MRREYRPDDAPGWKVVLWIGLGGLVPGIVYAVRSRPPITDLVSVTVASVILFAGIAALVVGIAKLSRLVVDGTEVVHRQVGRSQRASVVGAGWRLISYSTGYGRSLKYIRVLFDPQDRPLLMFNGAMWSRGLFATALGPLGVKIMDKHDSTGPSAIDSMTSQQIGALSDEEAARLMKATEDTTVPAMPKRVVRP